MTTESQGARVTRVLTVAAEQPDAPAIAEAARVLRAGGLVAFPTETVYGLGANALDAAAVERIFRAKGRPASDPLIVHLVDSEDLEYVAINVPPLAYQLAAYFWPGPLTLVLRRAAAVPANVSAGRDTVAVRVPRHPVAQALLRAAAIPIAAPSANLFARPSPSQASHVLDDLNGRIDLLLDGGPATIGLESTVLDITRTPAAVLRPGGIALEDLRAFLPDVVFEPAYFEVNPAAKAPAAPGMLLRHYSPHATLLVFEGRLAATLQLMRQEAARLAERGKRVGVMAPDEDAAAFAQLPVLLASLGARDDYASYAVALFACLRQLDAAHVDTILVRAPDRNGLGLAVWDRLFRGAEGQIIQVEATE